MVHLVSTTPKRLQPIWRGFLPLCTAFFPPLHLKGFVGDIDIRQSSRILTLAMSFENELMNQRKLPLIATRVSFVGTALHEDIRGWC